MTFVTVHMMPSSPLQYAHPDGSNEAKFETLQVPAMQMLPVV
jgi:hypothetical protein